jgi:stress response protein YsnF
LTFGDKISKLIGFDTDNRTYSEAVRRGHCVLTVDVDGNEAPRAEEIMGRYHPMDIDERAAQWRESGGQETPTGTQTTGEAGTQATGEERVIPVVEEEMQVGKRESRRGGTRVRSHNYTVPAEESVQLHEQHTDVSRRPADRPATEEDKATGEFDFETRDTAEEPVVDKQARGTEEVVVRHKSSDQTRTVKDDVRRTDVDVEEVDDEGKTTTDKVDQRRS